MEYYYILNINFKEKNQVDYWIKGKNFAPIFFGKTNLNDLLNENFDGIKQHAIPDCALFIKTFRDIKGDKNTYIFSIGNQNLYIYQQNDHIIEIGEDKNCPGDIIKGIPIEIIKEIPIKSCPLILSSIKSNRYIAQGTFKQLSEEKNYGNIQALKYIKKDTNDHVIVDSFLNYMKCLSSIEFETLIAKLLEENGFFVPAYKGGFIKNYDLFIKNLSDKILQFLGIQDEVHKIGINENKSIQVKLKLEKDHIKDYVDYYFCIEKNEKINRDNIFDWSSLKKILEDKNFSKTKKWLSDSLQWVTIEKKEL